MKRSRTKFRQFWEALFGFVTRDNNYIDISVLILLPYENTQGLKERIRNNKHHQIFTMFQTLYLLRNIDEEKSSCSNHVSYQLVSTLISGILYLCISHVEWLLNDISLFDIHSPLLLSVYIAFTNSLHSKLTHFSYVLPCCHVHNCYWLHITVCHYFYMVFKINVWVKL